MKLPVALIGSLLLIALIPAFVFGESMQYFSKTFTPGYQIEQRKITTAAENEDGFLLIGTIGAIYLFDGRQYEALTFSDSLSQVEVLSISAGNAGVLAGLSDGKVLYYNNIHLREMPALLLEANSKVTSILSVQKNSFIAATYGDGIYISEAKGITHLLQGMSFYSLVADANGRFWAGSDAGLVQLFHDGQTWKTKLYGTEAGLPDLIVTALHIDENNKLWVGMHDGGFCLFDSEKTPMSCKEFPVWQYGIVNAIYSLGGQVWLGSHDDGVYFWDEKKQVLEAFSAEKPSRMIQLVPSKLSGFWMIGHDQISWTAGTDIAHLQKPGGFDSGDIIALHAFAQDKIWISDSHGLHLLNPQKNLKHNIPFVSGNQGHSPVISCFFQQDSHHIWVGSFGQGLFLLDHEGSLLAHYTEKDGLPNNSILSVKGNENTLFIASLGGAGVANRDDEGNWVFKRFHVSEGPGTYYVYDVLYDKTDRVWFATDGMGIGLPEEGDLKHQLNDLFGKKTIYTICEDASAAVWLSVPDEGLYRISGDSILNIGIQQGLSSLVISALEVTGEHYMIAAGSNGIDLINTITLEIIQLGKSYGFETGQAALHGISKSADGSLYVITDRGLFQFQNPARLALRKPGLSVKQLLVNYQPSAFGEQHTFHYGERQLGLVVSPLWYPNPDAVQLNIHLGGEENQSYVTRDQNLNFGRLKPGNYTLNISTTNNINSAVSQLRFNFSVNKPLWQQWWLIGSLAVFLVIMVRYWLLKREQKIRKEQQILQEKLSFEYSNLRNQVNPHFLFNSFSTLIALIETQGKEASKYVEKLSDYFRQILQYRDTEMISLEEELQLLETYIFLQKQRYGDGLQTNILLPESAFQSKIPPMTLQMLAENALKHNVATRNSPLIINIGLSEGWIQVQNNIQPKQGRELSTGLGLDNISQRYRLFAGKEIRIEKSPAVFSVFLPLVH